jgi:para-aminobenzoate synthetase / 4-amino-4-deoxychorismate lyase
MLRLLHTAAAAPFRRPGSSTAPACRLFPAPHWFRARRAARLRAMTRAILDFPAAGGTGAPQRQCFAAPACVIRADSTAEVTAALQAVADAAAAGAWAVGFVGYEAAPAFDAALVTRPPAGPAPLLWFGVFDAPATAPPPAPAPAAPLHWHTATPRHGYDAAIREIRERIAAGDVYQVNHTLRFTAACDVDPLPLYNALVAARHGLYHAYIETDEWALVSASPELFFDLAGRSITTRPMKGTVRRGRWLEEDCAAARQLAASAKDRAENLMIVDLLRNDLGRIADFGTVAVPQLFDVETYPTVHQLTSTITARLRADVGLGDIFAATFPCGSVTGAPKVTAMRAIARLEDSPRGPYCGAVGTVRPDGSATFNVAIRTALLDRRAGRASYGAGGGITWDSRAAAEYDEVIAKGALLTENLPPFALLETMRLDDGVFARRELHLQRLRDSAYYWRFDAATAANAARALDELCAACRTGRWRVRLTADRDGTIRSTRAPLAGTARSRADADAAPPEPAAIARRAVSRHDRLLCHKTTARAAYDARRADFPDAFDVLLFNEEGMATEFTLGNLIAASDGRLLTPPREHGLLAGTLRAELLATGSIAEAPLSLADVRGAEMLYHVNSVRGFTRIRL